MSDTPIINSPMDLTVMLAQTKADLHGLVDEIKEADSVLLIVGKHRYIDGEATSQVCLSRRNANMFEALGMLEESRMILKRQR